MGLILRHSLHFYILCCLLRIPEITLVKLMRRMVMGCQKTTLHYQNLPRRKVLMWGEVCFPGARIHLVGAFTKLPKWVDFAAGIVNTPTKGAAAAAAALRWSALWKSLSLRLWLKLWLITIRLKFLSLQCSSPMV